MTTPFALRLLKRRTKGVRMQPLFPRAAGNSLQAIGSLEFPLAGKRRERLERKHEEASTP